MTTDSILLFLGVLNCLLVLFAIRVLGVALQSGLNQLDSMIAGAIQKVLEGDLVGSIEPPNPIQQAIAQFIGQRLQNVPIDMERSPDGKFSGEKIS